MKMSGEVLYNGKPLNKRAKRQVGYVMQDDLLYESLTVYETVRPGAIPPCHHRQLLMTAFVCSICSESIHRLSRPHTASMPFRAWLVRREMVLIAIAVHMVRVGLFAEWLALESCLIVAEQTSSAEILGRP